MDRQNVVYIYTRILFNLKKEKKIFLNKKKKEKNSKTCYNIDETGVHHNK